MALLVVIAAGGVAMAALSGASARPSPAPDGSELPLVTAMHVLASAPGGSDIDPAHDRRRYRYMAVAGPIGEKCTELLASEVRFLRARGWTDQVSWINGPDRSGLGRARRVSPSRPGATVMVNAPGGKRYAALDAIRSLPDARQQTDGSPLYGNPAISRALKRRQPVLSVLLGNGRHGPI